MTIYRTREEALQDIAGRSFYESARMHKYGDQYIVTDWYTGVEEIQPWTYHDGLKNVPEWLDHSHVHEASEYYDNARHIEYNLPSALAAIEEGRAVGFTYVVAEDSCDNDDELCNHPDGCQTDHAAGWVLIATDETDY